MTVGIDAPPEPLEGRASPAQPQRGEGSELRRSAWWWLRAAAVVITLLAGYQLLVVLGGLVSALLTVILYVVFGAVLAFVVGPAANLLASRVRLPRTLAILLVLGSMLIAVGAVIYLAAGPTADEARTLAKQVPGFIDRANGELSVLRRQLSGRGIDTGGLDLSRYSSNLGVHVTDILLTGITGTVRTLIDVLITLVVAFWLIKDGAELRAGLLSFLPGRLRTNVEFALDATAVVVGGYVRAQLFLALVIGVLAGGGCAALGVPFPIVVAVAAFIFELVPIIGPFLGGGVAVLLALTVSPALAVLTVGLFIGIHIIEGYILGPRIQAKFVRVHPVVSLLALVAGIELAGFLGALFAVPVASLGAVFIRAGVGDVRARRPDLYASQRADLHRERRRQRILGEFRIFKRSPMAMLRSRREEGARANEARVSARASLAEGDQRRTPGQPAPPSSPVGPSTEP